MPTTRMNHRFIKVTGISADCALFQSSTPSKGYANVLGINWEEVGKEALGVIAWVKPVKRPLHDPAWKPQKQTMGEVRKAPPGARAQAVKFDLQRRCDQSLAGQNALEKHAQPDESDDSKNYHTHDAEGSHAETYILEMGRPHVCQDCEEEELSAGSAHGCVECGMMLCHKCAVFHLRSKRTRDHTLKPLVQFIADNLARDLETHQKHNTLLKAQVRLMQACTSVCLKYT
jgi:hypothetical protein